LVNVKKNVAALQDAIRDKEQCIKQLEAGQATLQGWEARKLKVAAYIHMVPRMQE